MAAKKKGQRRRRAGLMRGGETMNQRKDGLKATDREWEQRAREDAAALGLPEAEVRRQTKAALIRIVAEAIARDDVEKRRRAQQAPPPTAVTFCLPASPRLVGPAPVT